MVWNKTNRINNGKYYSIKVSGIGYRIRLRVFKVFVIDYTPMNTSVH